MPRAVVAMSGGTGSALLAYIVASVFDENTVACIGRSGSVPAQRLERARYTADLMGEHTPIHAKPNLTASSWGVVHVPIDLHSSGLKNPACSRVKYSLGCRHGSVGAGHAGGAAAEG